MELKIPSLCGFKELISYSNYDLIIPIYINYNQNLHKTASFLKIKIKKES